MQAKIARREPEPLEDELDQDYEALDETAEEWEETSPAVEPLSSEDLAAIQREIVDLEEFRSLAISIKHNAKGQRSWRRSTRLRRGRPLGAARKAMVFTESRRTQEYLQRVLADSPYSEGVVLFNGSNTDPLSRAIYAEWLNRHAGTDRVTGSKSADMRSALVDYFREQGQIMIATEAGAEGINLQFCSLVVNYDLPWNPQRIEQRIGRCHRYGQKHDVVVVNFLNRNNEADQRVFRLLAEKFSLFEGVFGASDEVLGAIESGVDFEKRIAAIYQRCRTPEEIKASFDQLQLELGSQINDAMTRTRRQLLENFDAEVHDKLRISLDQSQGYLNWYERLLMQLTRYELGENAEFFNGDGAFRLKANPFPGVGEIPLGLYELPRRSGEAHLYRLGHPLAVEIVRRAKSAIFPRRDHLRLLGHPAENRQPQAVCRDRPANCWSASSRLSRWTRPRTICWWRRHGRWTNDRRRIRAADVLAAGRLGRGACPFAARSAAGRGNDTPPSSDSPDHFRAQRPAFRGGSRQVGPLGRRPEGRLGTGNQGSRSPDQGGRRAATLALTLEEKLAGQKQVRAIEGQRNAKRKSLFEAQDEIDQRRERLIAEIEGKLVQRAISPAVLAIGWRLA